MTYNTPMKISFSKDLPQNLTSYDFLKSFAVLTMIIDHIGMYLFPEQNEWRVIGRMSMPVWLFLVGYANSRDLSSFLWIGGSILVLSTVVMGEGLLPFNILFTILFVRFFLDGVMRVFLKDIESKIFTILLMVILVVPTGFIFDYGTHAFLFAIYGYLVRHQNKLNISRAFILAIMGVAVVVHSFYQRYHFGFDYIEAVYSAAGMLGISLFMIKFQSKLYPNVTKRLPMLMTAAIQLMGRHSLEVYVVHLLVLKLISFYFYPEHFGLFEIKWF